MIDFVNLLAFAILHSDLTHCSPGYCLSDLIIVPTVSTRNYTTYFADWIWLQVWEAYQRVGRLSM